MLVVSSQGCVRGHKPQGVHALLWKHPRTRLRFLERNPQLLALHPFLPARKFHKPFNIPISMSEQYSRTTQLRMVTGGATPFKILSKYPLPPHFPEKKTKETRTGILLFPLLLFPRSSSFPPFLFLWNTLTQSTCPPTQPPFHP